MNIARSDDDEYDKGEDHAKEGHQEAYGEADVLLNVGHAQVSDERTRVDEPVKPISNQ